MTTAFTVVEPTSIPIRKFLSMVGSRQANDCGADPLVRGRRPRRPSRTVVPVAGRGRPGPEGTPTRGSAPPYLIRPVPFGGHARRDVVHEICGAAHHALLVGNLVERAFGFGMGFH